MSVLVKNTETIGLWVEMLLCRVHSIPFSTSREYVNNLDIKVEDSLVECLTLSTKGMSITEHTGFMNNHHDFILEDGTGLSVKTNITGDKVCPPKIGQTTLTKMGFSNSVEYKNWVLGSPEEVFKTYSDAMFQAEHTIYVNFSKGVVYNIKRQNFPAFDRSRFSFTRNIENWNESCSMKLDKLTVAEFQVHNNRNCIKCRFNMNNLLRICTASSFNFTKTDIRVTKNIGTFNYIGSKTKLLSFLKDTIQNYTNKPLSAIESFYDLFAGTGVVSSFLIENGCKNIITNDNMYYSYVLCSCLTSDGIDVSKVSSIIEELNNIQPVDGYVFNTYSNKRMYFTPQNASKIDSIRIEIDRLRYKLTAKEYNILLKILLYSCSKVANISSTYGAYLKKYKSTSIVDLKMTKIALDCLYEGDIRVTNYNSDIIRLVNEVNIVGDVCYIDPPYNSRKYSSNYFVINSIAKYDNAPISEGVTGLPLEEPEGSGYFCSKSKAMVCFRELFSKISTRYIFMSYNSESLLTKDEVITLLNENNWVNVVVKEKEYQRFKSNSKTEQSRILYEYVFCATKKA